MRHPLPVRKTTLQNRKMERIIKKSNQTNGFANHTICDRSSILSQMARENVLAVDEEEVRTRILFGSGRQRSHISESWLKLKTIRTGKVVIKTFKQSEEREVQKLD